MPNTEDAVIAAMEPGLRDREYSHQGRSRRAGRSSLQWSPVLETGNTADPLEVSAAYDELQWSPVLETGNTPMNIRIYTPADMAAMEPGLRDREYSMARALLSTMAKLQWSPVLETGNTLGDLASDAVWALAAMEPGLRDREYKSGGQAPHTGSCCCNGARS